MLVLAMMAGLLVAPVSAADSKFTDTGSHWAKTSIERWAEAGIINGSENKPNGVGNGTFSFRPNDPITRGEFAKILTYVMGLTKPAENVFSDLNDSHWYKNDVLLCVNAGIINGYGNEKDGYTFRGGNSITRAEAASMLIRAFNAKEGTVADLEAKNFKDFNLLKDHWAKGALAGAVNYSALGGYADGTLKPNAEITRAEVCVMLDRLAAVYVSKTGEVSTTTQGEIDKNNTGNFVIVSAECTEDVVVTADKDNKITVTVGEQKADITVQNGVAPTVVVEKQTQELPKDETPVQVDGKDEKDEDDKAEIHTHAYTYSSNKDGTHNSNCACGEDGVTNEACTYGDDGKCTKCGYEKPADTPVVPPHEHDYTYTSNDNGTHNGACACGKDAITNEACEYKDGICVKCEFVEGAVAKDANGTYYTDLQKAVDAGGEVTLLKSVELSETVKINAEKVTLDLNGKTITGTDTKTASFALIEIQPDKALTVTDSSEDKSGKITLTATNDRDWNAYSTVISNQRGELIVEGGTLEHLGGTDMAYAIDNLTNTGAQNAETTINGGVIKSTYRAIRQFLNSSAAGVKNTLTVNGGTIEGGNKSIWMQDSNTSANPGTLTVSENAKLIGDVLLSYTEGSATWPLSMAISDAALVGESAIMRGSSVPECYQFALVDGIWGVKNVTAAIGDVYYDTLEEAIAAAEAGDTVKLVSDVDLNAYVTITKTLTLNLNGYCIERTKGTVLYINAEDAVVTIQGEGTVTGDHAVYVGAGKAVIQSGTFAGGSHAVYVQGAGEAEIYGGTFSAVPDDNGTYFVLNQYDSDRATSSITVYGGTYANFNPANNLAENAGTNFVAEGYESVAGDNNTWTVRQIAE